MSDKKALAIQTEDGQSGGRYFVVINGYEAEMTFSRLSPQTIIVDHTGVPDALSGQGIAFALAEFAIAAARAGGWKIIPLCPYMRAQSLKHPEWADAIRQN